MRVTRTILIVVWLGLAGVSVLTRIATGYSVGQPLHFDWNVGPHGGGAVFGAAAGLAFALLNLVLPINAPRQPIAFSLTILVWVSGLAWAGATVLLVGSSIVRPEAPALGSALLMGLWTALDLAAGLLPAIIWPVTTPVPALPRDPASPVSATEHRGRLATSPPRRIEAGPARDVLLRLLERLAAGAAADGVRLEHNSIITHQRSLADLADLTLSCVHRALHSLKYQGKIDLDTSARQTVIRLRSPSTRRQPDNLSEAAPILPGKAARKPARGARSEAESRHRVPEGNAEPAAPQPLVVPRRTVLAASWPHQ